MTDTSTVTQTDGARTSDAELAALRAQLKQEREEKDALRHEAETYRKERDETGRKLVNEVDQKFQVREQAIADQLSSAANEADNLEARIAELHEKGEFKEVAKVTRALTEVSAKVRSLEQEKENISNYKERAKAKAAEDASRAQSDPLNGMTEPAKRWIRAHPKWMSDQSYKDRVTAAHFRAKAEGIQVDSDRYFEFVEKEIGERKDPETKVEPKTETTTTPTKADGGTATTDSPLSEASTTQDADEGAVVIEDEGTQVVDDEAAEAVKLAQQKAQERAKAREVKPNNTSSAAPPSRSGTTGTTRRSNGQGVRLTAIEAEVALGSYPPGEYPGIKTKEDAYRKYHAVKMDLESEGRLVSRSN